MDMKKKIAILVAGVVAAVAAVSANAAITVNGNTSDEDAVVVDGVAMVPYRTVMEGIGFEIAWDAETKTATATDEDGCVAEVTVGSNKAVSGDTEVDMDAAAQIVDEKLYIPASLVGAEIDEDGNVTIVTADYVASDAAVDVVESEAAVDVEDAEETTEEATEETTEAVETAETVEEETEETTETAVVEAETTEGDEDAAVEE
jgi:hypothetical protein